MPTLLELNCHKLGRRTNGNPDSVTFVCRAGAEVEFKANNVFPCNSCPEGRPFCLSAQIVSDEYTITIRRSG